MTAGPTVGAGCTLVDLARHGDDRGTLVVGETGGGGLAFPVERFFVVQDVPGGGRRGAHANRRVHELLVAVLGSVAVELDDGRERASVVLDRPDVGLHIPPLTWSTQTYGSGACLLVLASAPFDPGDHVHDRDEFLRLVAGGPGR